MKDENNDKKELSKLENLTIGTISSLGCVILYGTGINLSKTCPNSKPIFIGTIILSFLSPHLLQTSFTYTLKKYHQRKRKDKKKSIRYK